MFVLIVSSRAIRIAVSQSFIKGSICQNGLDTRATFYLKTRFKLYGGIQIQDSFPYFYKNIVKHA
jgi:hypothetical protein